MSAQEYLSQASEKLSTGFGFFAPTRSRLGFELWQSDPVTDFAKKMGLEVIEYDIAPYPVATLLISGAKMLGFMIGSSLITWILYHYVARGGNFLGTYGSVGAVGSFLLAWPLLEERSGAMLADFWKPALGFRSALLLWDIFHIRTREEVESWNFARFFCHLWAFPVEEDEIAERTKEEGFARSARWQNAKGLPKVAVEGVLLLLTLYLVPPADYTKDMSQLAYHLYCDGLGLSILMALALFGDGLLKIIGIICNVEMADMFENPLGTINIRLFWSHWNRAIATVLHRVVFGGGRNTKSSKVKELKKRAQAQAAQGKPNGRSHLDHLSETEFEHSKTDDEDERSRRARASGLKPMTQVNGAGAAKPEARGSSKPRSPFFPKAIAAVATFAMSGIFHEHITYNTLGIADGKNFAFFVLNGLATVTSTWFKRTYPELNAKIPTFVAVLMLHAFFLAIVPLFCSPFIKSGFFIQLNALKYELLPIVPRQRGAWIALFGR